MVYYYFICTGKIKYTNININTMNTLMKSLGGIILLIGVGILLIPTFKETHNNMYLLIGLGTIILGFLLHIFLNKRFE